MAVKYLSNRVKDLRVGISNYSETKSSLTVVGNVGIGTETPTDVVGVGNTAVLAAGIVTAYRIYSTLYGQFEGGSVTADRVVGSALSISGISTLGTVKISSGIVTAASGVVTYYGDGSNLSGVGVPGINTTGTTTFETVVINANAGIGSLNVTGVSTISSLNVTGVSTFAGNINANGNIVGDNSTNITGIAGVTATTFSGSGASLTSIPNSALDNSTVSYGGVSLALGASDATPAFDLADATNYPTSSLTGTITNAQLAGSIANDKLANSTVSYGGISLALGGTDATPAFNLTDATNYPYTSLTGVATHIVGDTTPQLGGNLDGNSKSIYGVGVITATTLDISGDVDVDGHTELDNVNIAGIATVSQLKVAGIATFNGNRIDISTWVSHIGDSDTRFGFYGPNELTFETGGTERLHINSSGLQVTNGAGLHVAGVSTFAGNINANGNIVGDDATNISGINSVTATTYYGDGSKLTGIGINTEGTSTFEDINVHGNAGIGSLSVSGVSTFSGAVTADGVVSIADSINHIGNTNTAIRFPSANTFTVETAASEAIRIDSSQRLLVGHTASDDRDGYQTSLQVSGTGGNDSSVSLGRWSADQGGPGLILSKSRDGTIGGHTVVAADDYLGSLQFQGDDGSGYHVGAQIHAIVQSGVGNDDMPTDLVFATNNGSTSATERLRITSEGHTIPGVDSTSDLGLTGTRWRNLYADTLYGDGSNLTNLPTGITTGGTSTFETIVVNGNAGIGSVNVTGVSTFVGDATFSGNVSIAGTITYDDVTNIDSVGIVTAGKGLRATTGGLVVTAGVSTFSDSIGVAVDKFINLKNSSDATKFSIRHQNSGETTFNNTQSGANVQFLNSTNSSAAFEFRVKYGFGAASGFDLNGNGHLVPAADSASDLGLTGTRWRNLYAYTLYGDGSTLTGVASTTILEDAGINTAGTSTFTNILATGIATAANFDSTSDIRLKTNIEVIQDPLAKVIQIEGVSFNWKQDNRPALGVIADQVQQILPQLVHGDQPKTVNYIGLIGLLIEAVKEQQIQIDELKSKLS